MPWAFFRNVDNYNPVYQAHPISPISTNCCFPIRHVCNFCSPAVQTAQESGRYQPRPNIAWGGISVLLNR
jgi:hypothetical protein